MYFHRQTVVLPTELEFSCEIKGIQMPIYTWKTMTEVEAEKNSKLVKCASSTSDRRFMCTVRNGSFVVLDRYCVSVSIHSLLYSIGEYDISVCVSQPIPIRPLQ